MTYSQVKAVAWLVYISLSTVHILGLADDPWDMSADAWFGFDCLVGYGDIVTWGDLVAFRMGLAERFTIISMQQTMDNSRTIHWYKAQWLSI